MAVKQSILDKYDQRVCVMQYSIPTAVGTSGGLTKFASQYNPKDMLGLVIHRVSYHFLAGLLNLDAVTDSMRFGLTVSPTEPAGGPQAYSPGVIDINRALCQYGTLVGLASNISSSVIKDFTNLTGGGLLCHPASLYVFGVNDSVAAWAGTVKMDVEVFYTLTPLEPADWQEMWQLGYISTTI